MATRSRIRIALFGNSYFRVLVTPDCKFDLWYVQLNVPRSAIVQDYRVKLVDSHDIR